MQIETVIYVLLGGLAGGFVNGLAGMGTSLFALGFFLVVLDPVSAVALTALLAVLAGVQGLWISRAVLSSDPRRWLRFTLPGILGVPLGLMLLDWVDPAVLRRIIAAVLVLYGGYFGLRRSLPRLEGQYRWVDRALGFVGGILGGFASLSGVLPTIWLSMRAWPRAETRAVLQSYNFSILLFTVAGLALRGAYEAQVWVAFAVVLPAGVLAAQAGIFAFRRINDAQFQRLLVLLCLCLGLGMLVRELLAG